MLIGAARRSSGRASARTAHVAEKGAPPQFCAASAGGSWSSRSVLSESSKAAALPPLASSESGGGWPGVTPPGPCAGRSHSPAMNERARCSRFAGAIRVWPGGQDKHSRSKHEELPPRCFLRSHIPRRIPDQPEAGAGRESKEASQPARDSRGVNVCTRRTAARSSLILANPAALQPLPCPHGCGRRSCHPFPVHCARALRATCLLPAPTLWRFLRTGVRLRPRSLHQAERVRGVRKLCRSLLASKGLKQRLLHRSVEMPVSFDEEKGNRAAAWCAPSPCSSPTRGVSLGSVAASDALWQVEETVPGLHCCRGQVLPPRHHSKGWACASPSGRRAQASTSNLLSAPGFKLRNGLGRRPSGERKHDVGVDSSHGAAGPQDRAQAARWSPQEPRWR